MVAPIVNTGIQTAKYCNVAGLGVLVRWTWNGRWNASRVLFVISRYMAFVAAGMTAYGEQLVPVSPAAIATRDNEDCSHFSAASNAIHIISIVAAEGLLIIRTYAFWKQSKRLLAILLVLAAISIACAVSITQVVGNLTAAPVDPSVVSVANIVIMSVVPASYDEMMDVMLASRVLFSLRESDQEGMDGTTLKMSTFLPA
ncbi:hypothetical protein EDB19DRAFT_1827634 [Suillus lakei]|nr:hypothetical protein EDB19DRAFT_1827634 [Suillus lakei]